MSEPEWHCKTCGKDVRDGMFYGGTPPEHVTCREVAAATAQLRADVARLTAENAKLRAVAEAARAALRSHDGCHAYEDCGAWNAPDVEAYETEEARGEHYSAPLCSCGQLTLRNTLRATLSALDGGS